LEEAIADWAEKKQRVKHPLPVKFIHQAVEEALENWVKKRLNLPQNRLFVSF
jgi:hypothetical protein